MSTRSVICVEQERRGRKDKQNNDKGILPQTPSLRESRMHPTTSLSLKGNIKMRGLRISLLDYYTSTNDKRGSQVKPMMMDIK